MARIKYVLNERRLAYDGALKLAEKQIYEGIEKNANRQPFDSEDRKVLTFQRGQIYKERVEKAAFKAPSVPRYSPPTEEDGTPKRGRRRGQPKPSKRSREATTQLVLAS